MCRDYVLKRAPVPAGARVLDVGPGTMPLRGDSVWYLDRDPAFLAGLPQERTIVADLDRLPLPLRDKEFDFVWCSHALEHVADVVAVVAELSRVGKRGVLATPHAFKDAIFNFEAKDHRWWFFPPVAPGAPVRAMQVDPVLVQALSDPGAQRALCRVFRSNPELSKDHALLNVWTRTHEPQLDVIVPWEGELRVEVIG